jgi:3-hydroxyisobutyrate dehydrogenase-like beta-hydroxyacid dehydrogenase
MGGAIVQRLRECSLNVSVRDIDPAREREAAAHGAQPLPTPAALARACDALLIVVVDAAQAGDVLFGADGAAAALKPGQAVLLMSTIAPGDVEDFAARLQAAGVDVLDAPMSGGPARARAGTMSLMVGADAAVFSRWQPLLRVLAEAVFHVGARAGDGARTKLVNNLLAAINLAGACEAMALAECLGLDASTTLAVIEASSGQSWIGGERLRRVIAGDPTPHAAMALLAKDSGLAMREAQAHAMRLPLGAAAAARFDAACRAGLAQADDAALAHFVATASRPESAR